MNINGVDINLKPTQGMLSEARRYKAWKEEREPGGTDDAARRANQILSGKELDPDVVITMAAWFARHEVDKKGEGFKPGQKGYPSKGRVAWAAWGGDPGQTWATEKAEAIKKAREKKTSDAVVMHDMALLLNNRLSDNIGETPQGYLVCKNVPVARTGVQYYHGFELGLHDRANESIPVYRLPEDVFHPEALKSLESMPVTDDHTEDLVLDINHSHYAKGHARHVRHDDGFVIADLVITDPLLKQKILNKQKYQISLGYVCDYVPYKDGFKQQNIRINHIAVVETGRAGSKVCIKDEKPVAIKEGKKRMDKKELQAKVLAAFAKDSSAEELEAAIGLFITDAAQNEKAEAGLLQKLIGFLSKDEKMKDEETEMEKKEEIKREEAEAELLKKFDARLAKIEELIAKMAGKKETADEHEDVKEDIDLIEKILAAHQAEEEVEEEAEEEEEIEEEQAAFDEEEKKEERKAAAMMDALKALKPVIAKLPAASQKQVKDALRKQLKGSNSYAAIQKAVNSHAKTQDSVKPEDAWERGKKIAASRNPHYKK